MSNYLQNYRSVSLKHLKDVNIDLTAFNEHDTIGFDGTSFVQKKGVEGSTIEDLQGVSLALPNNGDILQYNSTSSEYEPVPIPGGGGGVVDLTTNQTVDGQKKFQKPIVSNNETIGAGTPFFGSLGVAGTTTVLQSFIDGGDVDNKNVNIGMDAGNTVLINNTNATGKTQIIHNFTNEVLAVSNAGNLTLPNYGVGTLRSDASGNITSVTDLDATIHGINIRPDELEVSSTTLANKSLLRYNGSQWSISPEPLTNIASDVNLGPMSNLDVLQFNSGTSRLENKTLNNALIVTTQNIPQTVNGIKTFTSQIKSAAGGICQYRIDSTSTSACVAYANSVASLGSTIGLQNADLILRNQDGGNFIFQSPSLTDRLTVTNGGAFRVHGLSEGVAQCSNNGTFSSTIGNNGDVLTTSGTSVVWQAPAGGASALNDLTDVTITTPINDQIIKYASGTWINATAPASTDADAIHDNVAGEIAAITAKNPAVSADLLLIEDSADLNNKKRVRMDNTPFVHLSGNQSISGVKKFNNIMVVNDQGFTTTNPNLSIQNSGSAFLALQTSGGLVNECFRIVATSGTVSDVTMSNQRSGKIAFNTSPTDNTAVERMSINNAGTVAINQIGSGAVVATSGALSSLSGTSDQLLGMDGAGTSVVFQAPYTMSNTIVGQGNIYQQKIGNEFVLKRISQGAGISVQNLTDSVQITNTAASQSMEGLTTTKMDTLVSRLYPSYAIQWDIPALAWKNKPIAGIKEISTPNSKAFNFSERFRTKKFDAVTAPTQLSMEPVEDSQNIKVFKRIATTNPMLPLGALSDSNVINGTAHIFGGTPDYSRAITDPSSVNDMAFMVVTTTTNNVRFNYNYGQPIPITGWEYGSNDSVMTDYQIYGSNTNDMTSVLHSDPVPGDSVLLFSHAEFGFQIQDVPETNSTDRILLPTGGIKQTFQYFYTKCIISNPVCRLTRWRPFTYDADNLVSLVEGIDYNVIKNATTNQPEIDLLVGSSVDIEVSYNALDNFLVNDMSKIVNNDNNIKLDQMELVTIPATEQFQITDNVGTIYHDLDVPSNLTSINTNILKTQKAISSALTTYVAGSPNQMNVHDNTIIIAIATTNTVILPSPTIIGSEYTIIDNGLNSRAVTTNELIIQVPTGWTLNGVTDGSRTIISDGGFIKCLYSGGVAFHVTGFDL